MSCVHVRPLSFFNEALPPAAINKNKGESTRHTLQSTRTRTILLAAKGIPRVLRTISLTLATTISKKHLRTYPVSIFETLTNPTPHFTHICKKTKKTSNTYSNYIDIALLQHIPTLMRNESSSHPFWVSNTGSLGRNETNTTDRQLTGSPTPNHKIMGLVHGGLRHFRSFLGRICYVLIIPNISRGSLD